MAATYDPTRICDDVEAFIHEIERYLATVDLFRSEGREPVWESERSAQSSMTGVDSGSRVD